MPNNARGSYLLTSCHIGAANDETNAKRPKSEELLLLAGEISERRGYHVIQVGHDVRELLVSRPRALWHEE